MLFKSLEDSLVWFLLDSLLWILLDSFLNSLIDYLSDYSLDYLLDSLPNSLLEPLAGVLFWIFTWVLSWLLTWLLTDTLALTSLKLSGPKYQGNLNPFQGPFGPIMTLPDPLEHVFQHKKVRIPKTLRHIVILQSF